MLANGSQSVNLQISMHQCEIINYRYLNMVKLKDGAIFAEI